MTPVVSEADAKNIKEQMAKPDLVIITPENKEKLKALAEEYQKENPVE